MERRREKREEKGEDERGRREVSQEAEEKYGGDRERERDRACACWAEAHFADGDLRLAQHVLRYINNCLSAQDAFFSVHEFIGSIMLIFTSSPTDVFRSVLLRRAVFVLSISKVFRCRSSTAVCMYY